MFKNSDNLFVGKYFGENKNGFIKGNIYTFRALMYGKGVSINTAPGRYHKIMEFDSMRDLLLTFKISDIPNYVTDDVGVEYDRGIELLKADYREYQLNRILNS
jgi:hypothetical protein